MPALKDVVEKCITNLVSKFQQDQFKYFAERDLHFELQEGIKREYLSGPGNKRSGQEWRGRQNKTKKGGNW